MKTLILTILFLLGAAYRLTATDADPQQLLKAAESQADIFQENAGPFQMEVDFVVQNQVQASGHLTYKWEAKDKWWRKTTMTGYEEIDIRNGEKESIVRNIGFTPARAKELFSLFHFMDGISKLQFKKQKAKTDRGIQLSCIQVRKGEEKQTHELCIDATLMTCCQTPGMMGRTGCENWNSASSQNFASINIRERSSCLLTEVVPLARASLA